MPRGGQYTGHTSERGVWRVVAIRFALQSNLFARFEAFETGPRLLGKGVGHGEFQVGVHLRAVAWGPWTANSKSTSFA
eukprot:8349815-Pyramimonas_sp.AAC.1